MQGLAFVLWYTNLMLNKLIVTEAEEGWFLTFNGLMTTEESIEIDEQTAQTILHLQQVPV